MPIGASRRSGLVGHAGHDTAGRRTVPRRAARAGAATNADDRRRRAKPHTCACHETSRVQRREQPEQQRAEEEQHRDGHDDPLQPAGEDRPGQQVAEPAEDQPARADDRPRAPGPTSQVSRPPTHHDAGGDDQPQSAVRRASRTQPISDERERVRQQVPVAGVQERHASPRPRARRPSRGPQPEAVEPVVVGGVDDLDDPEHARRTRSIRMSAPLQLRGVERRLGARSGARLRASSRGRA